MSLFVRNYIAHGSRDLGIISLRKIKKGKEKTQHKDLGNDCKRGSEGSSTASVD